MKYLVTAGCSFSQVPNNDQTWPLHLNNYLQPEHVKYLGMGAAGNGIISRKVIWYVDELLKQNVNPADILVGIMWSGPNRLEVFNTGEIPHTNITRPIGLESYANPVHISSTNRFWYILNQHFDDPSTKLYFQNFYDEVYAMILTIEHILRVQWFLKTQNIKYFMTTYAPKTLDNRYSNHVDCKYLRDQIDNTKFLPVDNFLDWVLTTFKNPFDREGDGHPNTTTHYEFVHRIIIPFLKNNELIQ